MRNSTATFIGHSDCSDLKEAVVAKEIDKLIQKGYTRFLCGGMGRFDWLCARYVYQAKIRYPNIENFLVIPYLTFSVAESLYFDAILYPEGFEKYHFKAAIPKRNQYLVDSASAALCYVTHSWGGAAKTYRYALRQKLNIINLGSAPTSSLK